MNSMGIDITDLVKKAEEEKKISLSFTLKQNSAKELKKIAQDFEIPLSQLVDHIIFIFLQEYPEMQKEKSKLIDEFVNSGLKQISKKKLKKEKKK